MEFWVFCAAIIIGVIGIAALFFATEVFHHDPTLKPVAPFALLFGLVFIVIGCNGLWNTGAVLWEEMNNPVAHEPKPEQVLEYANREDYDVVEFEDGYVPVFYKDNQEHYDSRSQSRTEDYLWGAFNLEHGLSYYDQTTTTDLLNLKSEDEGDCKLAGVNEDLYKSCTWAGDKLIISL